jgi:hypothetical protein
MADIGGLGNSVWANVVWLADSRVASMPKIGKDACSVLANVVWLANSILANCARTLGACWDAAKSGVAHSMWANPLGLHGAG